MKNQATPGFWSSQSDEKLFFYLHQFKVATVEQINRDIYQYAKLNTLYWRLLLLQRLGFIRSCHHHDLGKKKIVSLTEKGFGQFISDGTERTVELKSQAILHDLALVDVKHHLLRSNKISRFYSENELKTWNTYWQSDDFSKFIDVRCDGAVEATLSGGNVTFAVELETTQKNHERSQEIVTKYYQKIEIPAVLFICGNESIRKLFLNIETQYLSENVDRKSGKFFYICLDELLQRQSLVFVDLFGNRLRLDESFTDSKSPNTSQMTLK
ncbi:MAG: hypothetical protein AB7T49_06630 [Oligoflexales bacterium]